MLKPNKGDIDTFNFRNRTINEKRSKNGRCNQHVSGTATQSTLYIDVYINRHIDYNVYDVERAAEQDARESFYRYVGLFFYLLNGAFHSNRF